MRKQQMLLFFAILFLAGCNGKANVSGTVKFTDGTPLDCGSVQFSSESYTVFGDIKPDGKYSLGELKDGDGIKPGTYTVTVQAAKSGIDNAPPTSIVDESFSMTCDVKGSMTFNIEVPPVKK